jgi:citrate lyase subunit beta/citryl-CoA lyase
VNASVGPLLRSFLYVPGDAGTRLLRATAQGADAVIADLEDSVAPSRRLHARASVAAWLSSAETGTSLRWVRVNAGADGIADLRATYSAHLDGVVLAKVEDVATLDEVARTLAELVPPGGTRPRIMGLVESAHGLRDIDAIARHPACDMLQLGELDLAADLGLDPDPETGGIELLLARSQVVLASAAAGIAPPLGAVATGYTDLEAFRTATEQLRRLGFVGRAAIHPGQLPVIHDVFTPSADQVRTAQALVDAYERALAAGTGAITDGAGRMVDEAVIRTSRRTLDLARHLDPTR